MKKTTVKEIIKFREAVKNIVSMLTERRIPVIERGAEAYVQYDTKTGQPVLICIPSIPDDASSEFLMAIRGFIDHEVAHVLFTEGLTGKGFVWNAVEDTFIERKMGEMFKGSKSNLINTQNHVIETVFIPKEKDALAEKSGDPTRMFFEFYLVPILRSWSGQLPFIDYMKDRWERVSEPVSLLLKHGVDKMIPNIQSTSDSVAVAAKIVQLLVDKPMESKDEDKSDEGESSPGLDDSSDEPQPDSVPGAEQPSLKGLSDKTSDTNDGSEETTDSDGGTDSEGSDAEEGEKEDDATETGDIPKPSKKDIARLEEIELPEGSDDMSMEGAMKSIITRESLFSTGYRPYERTHDFMGKMEDAAEFFSNILSKRSLEADMYGDVENYRVLSKHESVFDGKIKPLIAGDIVATLAKDLERAIASKNRTQFIPGQRRGRLHGPSLHRLTLDDDRVFRKKDIRRAVNSCVQIVIDMSGSMKGSKKIETACAAAYTLADALSRINVKTMITGFTTSTSSVRGKKEFNRSEALFLPIIKTWEAPVTGKQLMLNLGATVSTMILAENIDGESILALTQHFSSRTEDRKIMLVLSDGAPASQGHGLTRHLKNIAKQIEEDSDIHLMGIGIMTDAPRHYYRDNICLNEVSELSETLIKQMQRLLS